MDSHCPHCCAVIEIYRATHACLQSHAHSACPACNGPVLVPGIANPRLQLSPAPASHAATPVRPAPYPKNAATTSRKTSHNLLILGATALLVLGGIDFVLALEKSNDASITTQNIDNEIINNPYFQNLIASGHAKVSDLQTISGIRPFRDGFIGISEETLTFSQAEELAKRTASSVLVLEQESSIQLTEITKWFDENINSSDLPTFWVTSRNEAKVLDGSELLSPLSLQRKRKVVLQWNLPTGKIGETAETGLTQTSGAVKHPRPIPTHLDRTAEISRRLAVIDKLERKLASLNGSHDKGLHNELRHNYHGLKSTYRQIAVDNERIEMWHCNEIFMHHACDEYTLECISEWKARTDPRRAAELLLGWTEKYPEFPYLTAACLVRSAELLGPETGRGKEILLQFLNMYQPELDEYRIKAQSISKTSHSKPSK